MRGWRRRSPIWSTRPAKRACSDILDAALGNDRRKLDRFFAGLRRRTSRTRRGARMARTRGDAMPQAISAPSWRARSHMLRAARDWLDGGSKTDVEDGGRAWREFWRSDFAPTAFAALARAVFLTKDGEPRKKLATKKLADARPDLLAYLTDAAGSASAQAEERRRAARAAALAEAALTLIDAVRARLCRRQAAPRRAGL